MRKGKVWVVNRLSLDGVATPKITLRRRRVWPIWDMCNRVLVLGNVQYRDL